MPVIYRFLVFAALLYVFLLIYSKRALARRKRLGYYVSVRGGVWTVEYIEGEKRLLLHFEMGIPTDILYVPSERDWLRDMPDWAKDRREEILVRIRQELGPKWIFD